VWSIQQLVDWQHQSGQQVVQQLVQGHW
jgi:hypothetical protein